MDGTARKQDDTDLLLNLAESDVRDRREIVGELDEWDHFSLVSYISDLPLFEDRFLWLRGLYESRAMTDEQRSRFEKIMSHSEEHEANLEAIFARCERLRKTN